MQSQPRPCILAVDDEADLLATYERLLGRQGYRVTTATTRSMALDGLGREHPVLVVADLRLADGDGLDVVRAARALGTPPLVIVVTGFPSSESRQQALNAGASAYLLKPFRVATFAGLVQDLLHPQSRGPRP
ncbi:MAG TPA: response regulator [Methylomirabilota bacterium]|jgi:two-component system response regulator HydG|nr:response regulator [Methylomirabilota bacterium]